MSSLHLSYLPLLLRSDLSHTSTLRFVSSWVPWLAPSAACLKLASWYSVFNSEWFAFPPCVLLQQALNHRKRTLVIYCSSQQKCPYFCVSLFVDPFKHDTNEVFFFFLLLINNILNLVVKHSAYNFVLHVLRSLKRITCVDPQRPLLVPSSVSVPN